MIVALVTSVTFLPALLTLLRPPPGGAVEAALPC
jgi:hypothetical protein